MLPPAPPAAAPVAVLLGGGIESTLLVREFLGADQTVVPIHVHCGLIWDDAETRSIARFLSTVASKRLLDLIEIRIPLTDFLKDHWAVTGRGVPRAGAPAGSLELPLRNLTLLSFALSRLAHVDTPALAMGTTIENHFRDGSRDYFDRCEALFAIEAGRPVRILTPLIGLSKTDVIRQSDRDTLAHSFSCVEPRDDRHCGECVKCGLRQDAFRIAGVADPTGYASQ